MEENDKIMLFTEEDLDLNDKSDEKYTFAVSEFIAEIETKKEYIDKLGSSKFFKILTKRKEEINGAKYTNKHGVELEILIDDFITSYGDSDEDMPSVAYFNLFAEGTHQGVFKTIDNNVGIGHLSDKILKYFKEVAKELAKELKIRPTEVFTIRVSFLDNPFYKYAPMKTKEFKDKAKSLLGKKVCRSFDKQEVLGVFRRLEEGLAWVENEKCETFGYELIDLEEYKTNAERFILAT